MIRWLNLPLKDPAAVGLETPYKVGIIVLTNLWLVIGVYIKTKVLVGFPNY